jgi:hypothetical protein
MNKKNESFVLRLTQTHRHIKGRTYLEGVLKQDGKTTVVALYEGNCKKLQKSMFRFLISIRGPSFRNRARPARYRTARDWIFFLL